MNAMLIVGCIFLRMHADVDSQPIAPVIGRDSIKPKTEIAYHKYVNSIDQKSKQIQAQIDRRTDKVLHRMLKLEQRMKAKLMRSDSVAARENFNASINDLQNLRANLKQKIPAPFIGRNKYLDTLSATLNFLGAEDKPLDHSMLQSAKDKVASLSNSFAAAADVKSLISSHRRQLKEKLSGYTALSKDLLKINKEVYYYAEQVKVYKDMLKDRKKAEAKAMELLKKTPLYTDFLKKHSTLASLLGNPVTAGANAPTLEGLQTRRQVEALIQQRIGNDPAARQAVAQQMDQAKAQLNDLKSKFPDADNAAEMPDFKPNPMKTKRFIQRLEFGGNVQFQKSNRYFPTTTDIAGQVGYKFHKNGTAGMGIAYKLGMGTGWNHIAISHQGMGFRSFVDWKLKGTFFINGGYEQNHVTIISQPQTQTQWSGWRQSALLGLSKKYKINAKMKGNIILLYDFLATSRMPQSSPLKVRIGYNF